MRKIVLAATLSTLLIAGCASGGGRSNGGGNPDVLSREELDQEMQENPTLYTVVARLRPTWLRARSSAGFSGGRETAVVVVNGSRYGELDALRDFHVNEVRQIRFVSATDATTRYGTGYAGGAIEITTR